MTASTHNTQSSSIQALAPAPAARPASRRVVDATTRMQHWLMALSFTGAYLSAESERWRLLHVTLGYTLAGLLVFRVLWGLFGPRQVRLAALGRKLQSQNWPMALVVPDPEVAFKILAPIFRIGSQFVMGNHLIRGEELDI